MSRKIRDGIIIDENIYTIDDTTQGIPSYMRVVQVLAVMLGAWSVVGMFVQGFSVPVLTAQVSLTIFIGGIILSLMALWESYDLYKAPIFLILYALFLRLTFAQFQNGFFIVENLVIKQLNSYFGLQILQYTANYTSATKDTTLIINFVVVIILALLSMAIFRNKLKHLCYVFMLIPVASCFIIGIIPKEKYLIVYLIVTIYLAKMHGTKQHYINDEQKQMFHKISIRTAMFLSMMSFVLFLVAKLIVNPIQYNDLVNVKEVKSEIQTALFEFNLEEFSTKLKNYGIQVGTNRNVATGGLDGGKLGKVDEVIFNETEQLHLTAPYISVASGIFLKGYVGSVYTGDSWGGLNKEMKLKYQELIENLPDQGYTPMDQTTLLLGYISKFRDPNVYDDMKQIFYSYTINMNKYSFYKGVMKIDYINANKKFLYVPYHTEFNLQEVEFVQDLYAAPVRRRDHYEQEYYFNVYLNDMEALLNFEDKPDWLDKYEETEKMYREYVYDVYTKLPTNGVDRLIREFSLPAEEYDSSKIMDKIAYIKDYLYENTTYTLSPGRLPEGKDFVEYFLYESHKGYCSHYASAATLMLRAMGIPARYVEGYSVDSQNIEFRNRNNNGTVQIFTNQEEKKIDVQMVKVVVKDSNAHAWVEVYLDGTGWLPMEFTPGANINNTSSLAQGMILFQEEITRSRESWEEKIDPTELPEVKNEEIQTEKNEGEQPKDQAINDDQVNDEAEVEQKEGESRNTIVLRLIIMLLIIIFGTVFYKYYLIIQKKNRLQKAKNPSKKALLLYRDIDKLLRVCKAIPKVDNSVDDMVAHVEKYCPYITDGSFSSCMETILKARFSKRSISLTELREVEIFYSNLKEMVYQDSSLGKKVYLKLI